jgi:two-component system chemotaxis sensor kinase CheA
MGDGRVALILDVTGLALNSRVVSEGASGRAKVEAGATAAAGQDDRQMLLLFRVGEDHRMAIPLSMVARLEEFPRSSIERAGHQQVVQYRDRLLPLIRLTDLLGASGSTAERETVSVVVYAHEGRDIGLVVENIIDIVEESLTVHRRRTPGAVYGTATIQQKVTDLLDVRALIESSDVLLFEHADTDLATVGA